MNNFEREKAAACFINIVCQENKEITFRTFKKSWQKLWGSGGKTIQNIYNENYDIIKDMSRKELSQYRNSFRGATVTSELKEKAMTFGLCITTGKNNNNLSGYRISISPTKSNCVVTGKYFDLTYDDVISLLDSFPKLEAVQELESSLISAITDDKLSEEIIIEMTKRYCPPYYTHKFAVKVNRLIRSAVVNDSIKTSIVNMGNRLGIVNLSNHRPLSCKKRKCNSR